MEKEDENNSNQIVSVEIGLSLSKVLSLIVAIVTGFSIIIIIHLIEKSSGQSSTTSGDYALILLGLVFGYITKKAIDAYVFNNIKKKIDFLTQPALQNIDNKEIVVKKLKKNLMSKGYKVAVEEDYLIQFKKNATTINIDLEELIKNKKGGTVNNSVSTPPDVLHHVLF